jgi:hypothetical protein
MIADDIRVSLRTQPFQPFAIHLADCRFFEIWHPDNAVLGARDRTISVLNSEKLIEVINLLLVVSVRPIKSQKQKSKR